MRKKVTFELDDVDLEMLDDFVKTSFPFANRSAVLRLAIKRFLGRSGYARLDEMDSSELMATLNAMGIKEGEKMPKWYRAFKTEEELKAYDAKKKGLR